MPASPLMFESDDDTVDNSAETSNKGNARGSTDTIELSKEEKIVKGFQTVLMGIPPPPAFTVPQLDCREILKLWRENQSLRVTSSPGKCENNRVFHQKQEMEAKTRKWPDALQLDYWDVYYNRTTASEEVERLSTRYKERYVGAETSSCVNALFAKSPTRTASARKRARNRAWGHSPGRRLSHLARRRNAFSSASLCSVAGNKNPDKKMIMVEIKKIGNRKIGQKKKGSVKKTKPTPKKKIETQSSTYKRALFQSPDQDPANAATKTPSTQCVQRSKRNLFADGSDKKNEFGKRERPMPKRMSPRKRVNRSLSFQESSQPPAAPLVAPTAPATGPVQPQALSGAHKQKMLWAATNALREEGMGTSHDLFRQCMTVLFRTCQRLWLTKAGAVDCGAGGTSERMLALAKRFSSYTIREISSDPTSEHMALVYNNSLKMAETMFSQPSVGTDSGNVTKDSSSVKKATIETKSNSLNKSKKVNINVSEVSSLSNCSTKIDSVKNTPSKINIKNSPRSSPRLTRKTCGASQVKKSVCSSLFSTETQDQKSEDFGGEFQGSSTNVLQVEDHITVHDVKKSESRSPFIRKLESDVLNKGNNTLRQTPLKNDVSVRETRSSKKEKLSECNSLDLPMNNLLSPSKTQSNDSKITNINVNENHSTPSVEAEKHNINSKGENKVKKENICKNGRSNECNQKEIESSPHDKQSPGKEASFGTQSLNKSCFVNLGTHLVNSRATQLSSLTVTHCSEPQSSVSHNDTNSIIQKVSSNSYFNITESFQGRRVTRSLSTDQVKTRQPIHHLFSPPTAPINGVQCQETGKKRSKKFNRGLDNELNTSSVQLTLPNIIEGDLSSEEKRVARNICKVSSDAVAWKEGSYGENRYEGHSKPKNDPNTLKDPFEPENLTRCLRSTKSPKTTLSRTDSCDTNSNIRATRRSSLKNSSSPEFVSPRTRAKKSKSSMRDRFVCSDRSPLKTTEDQSASSPEIISSVTRLRKASLSRRSSVVSSDASPCKETPCKSVSSVEYSADSETSGGTLMCESEKCPSQGSLDENSSDTNKENRSEESVSVYNGKNVENSRHSKQRHLSSVENTPTNQLVAGEPVNRMLQLYRLSSSGGDDIEADKLLPNTVCLDPPKLMPHWEAADSESEENQSLGHSPPSLTPQWEQESCSGTSTSLPESIMAHWQQLTAGANEESSDKVMFDFEDTSYEITFPTANDDDSRASSTCAPFTLPFLIDDSKSGFNNVFRRSSTEISD